MKTKQDKIDAFLKKLKEFRISHRSFNFDNHIQVQVEHNFYPTTGRYYNSNNGKKCFFPDFKDVSEFLDFIKQNTTLDKDVKISFVISRFHYDKAIKEDRRDLTDQEKMESLMCMVFECEPKDLKVL